MKKKLWVIAIITAILFGFIACGDDSGGVEVKHIKWD